MKILLTSASAKVPMLNAVKAAAMRIDDGSAVIAGDADQRAICQYFADGFWQMPRIDKSTTDEIIEGLVQRQITHVLPSRDDELLFWAKHKARLHKANIHVIVSEKNAVQQCLDKLAFSAIDSELSIPASENIDSFDNVRQFVVKERFGAGSASIALDVDYDEALYHAKQLVSPLFQPFVPGKEISIDAWLDKNHHVKAFCCRYREVVKAGESQITTTVALPEFEAQITDFLRSLQLCGPAVLQGIITQANTLKIIECNSRFGGASTLGIKAGVNAFYWSLAESLGENVASYPVDMSATPISQVRFATDMYL